MTLMKRNTTSNSKILKELEKRVEITWDKARSRRSSPKPARSVSFDTETATSGFNGKT